MDHLIRMSLIGLTIVYKTLLIVYEAQKECKHLFSINGYRYKGLMVSDFKLLYVCKVNS